MSGQLSNQAKEFIQFAQAGNYSGALLKLRHEVDMAQALGWVSIEKYDWKY